MIIHAAGESANNVTAGTFAVALGASSEQQLLKLEERLTWEQVPHAAFREPDAPFNGALMSIGIEPVDRRHVRRFLKNFSLIGENHEKPELEG